MSRSELAKLASRLGRRVFGSCTLQRRALGLLLMFVALMLSVATDERPQHCFLVNRGYLVLSKSVIAPSDQGRPDDSVRSATAFFERVLAADPKSGRAHLGLGQVYLIEGKLPQAQDEFLAATSTLSDNLLAYFFLGSTYERIGDRDVAIRMWQASGDAQSIGVYFIHIGEVHRAHREMDAARRASEIATILAPREVDAWSGLANVTDGDIYRSAIIKIIEVSRPGTFDHKMAVARLHVLDGRWHEAIQAYRTAMPLRPEASGPHRYIGSIYLHGLRDYQRAIAELEVALSMSPPDFWTAADLGNAYLHAGEFDKARQWFERAKSLDPTRTELDSILNQLSPSQPVQR